MTFNLADLWETLCDAGPDTECLIAGPVRHTRRSLDTAANKIGRQLRALDVRPGQHVGIYSRNRAEYVESLLGCWKAGAVPVNINWRYVAAELRHVVEDGELVAVVVDDEYAPMLDEVGFGRQVRFGSWAHQPGSRDFDDVPRSSDDIYLLYTGGTTGMPKGVMWRHEDFFYACCLGGSPLEPIAEPAQIARNAEPSIRLDPVALGPLMHGGGQWLTLIGLYCGGKAIVYCERSFDAVKVLDLAARERATSIGIIGDAMARPLAEAALAEPDRWDLSALVTLGNGGAMLSSVVKTQLHEAFPNVLLLDSFGASETGAAGSEIGSDIAADRPAFSTDGRTWVLDPETLRKLDAGTGEEGLLARRGHIPIGYWNDEEKTAAVFRTDGDGVRWVLPGDWATIDDQDRIVLLGRGSGCINTGGEKVFPEEVEAAIRSHPAVYDAVVVGVPDERLGECVAVVVQLRHDVDAPSAAAVRDHCRTSVAGYKVPRRIIFGEAPRTNVGKADYPAARVIAAQSSGSP